MSDTPSRFCLKHNEQYDIPEQELIWPEGLPGQPSVVDSSEVVNERGKEIYCRFISNISVPAMFAFPAPKDKNTGAAVIICPGGGYVGVAIDHEGFDLARFFNSLGISAFVLKYRCHDFNAQQTPLQDAPLSDALRTIRIVRSRAAQYGIDQHKVGIMGFSSGGHVAVTASTLYNSLSDPNPKLNAIPARPDFSILIYAVISLSKDYCHSGSRTNLFGLNPDFATMEKYSGECQVTEDTPPVFMTSTEDDAVCTKNSLNYFLACQSKNVPAELHVFPEGGHGYGMRIRGFGVDAWPDLMAQWLEKRLKN
jgi:acetyl esterase/lipase